MKLARELAAAPYALGGRVPSAAYAPADVEELAALLRDSDAARRAVVFFGGGTLQSLGHLPARYDVALDLRRLDRVVAYEYRDLTIAVEAGTTLAALDAALAEHGQFVPLDAPRAARATVGGTLASGWLGPRRTTYGRPRDFVIGATAILADGTLAKTGGMVVKNSTGYDLAKLYVGSLGTLGALTRANFKTLPLPATRRIAIAGLPDGTRERAIAHVAALAMEPAAALVVRGFGEIDGTDSGEGRMVLLFEGSQRSVERATRELRSALGSAGVPETRLVDRDVGLAFARIVDAYVATLGARSATYRSAGLPTEMEPRLEAFDRIARANELKLETIEDIRSGDVVARLSRSRVAAFGARLLAFDAERRGSLAEARILVAPETIRDRLDAWGAPPASLPVLQAVKDRFDPRGTLAPGRFVGAM